MIYRSFTEQEKDKEDDKNKRDNNDDSLLDIASYKSRKLDKVDDNYRRGIVVAAELCIFKSVKFI